MSRSRGQPKKHRIQVGFHLEPDLLLRMELALTPEGAEAPPHGAKSELVNELIRHWLDQRSKSNG